MFVRSLALVAVLCGLAAAYVPADEIKHLPGWDAPLPSRQFSGYLNITKNKHMHYWYVEAEEKAETAPVVLWLNGGPGCSSLYGFIDENGPFRIDPENPKQLVHFDYNWARQAHMFYLESPVGVGFSYSDDPADYITNDDKAATDNLAAVELFFKQYPHLAARPFFITGESYAGVYVPTLAEAVLHAEQAGTYTGAPLHGIAVGNGCTGNEIGVCGNGQQGEQFLTEYLLGQAFAPESLKSKIRAACDWTKTVSNECEQLVGELHNVVGNVNLYDIYGVCISGSAEANAGAANMFAPVKSRFGGPVACIDSIKETAYMNRKEVMEAAHVIAPPYPWAVCGNQIRYTSTRPNLPRDTYPALVENYRVLIFNGDWDACVPYTDNEYWTSHMNYEEAAAWHAWTFDNGQVGGYATRYNTPTNFTFITVKGGRHEVPETAPLQAYEMFRRFLAGEHF